MKTEIMWEQLLGNGLEHLILNQGAQIEVESLAVGVLSDAPYRILYQITCDAHWNVQKLSMLDLLGDKKVDLIRNKNSWLDGEINPMETFYGCTDVDIMVMPFTNTLPMRRLKLELGIAKEISVVYVSIPDLELSKLDQRYTCISKDMDGGIYRYENLSSGFTSELKVDADGLVVDYPGIFKMVWKNTNAK
jgi:uncharacterized protein